MTEAPELETALWAEAVHLGIAVRPVVLPTAWRVGPVISYLFPDPPVTLVDAGYDNRESRAGFEAAFAACAVEVEDLERIVVTHGHTDHYGCARWLQERSGCEVLMHTLDARDLARRDEWPVLGRELFGPLGLSEEMLDRFFGPSSQGSPVPPDDIRSVDDGEIVQAGRMRLRLEHRPGHSAGHLWAVEEQTRAIFAGDYLLAHTPTNAGIAPDPDHPLGRMPLLASYNAGLEAMASSGAPVVFPGHGVPITDHAGLVGRRLAKSHRRTQHVFEALRSQGESTPLGLALHLYGERIVRDPWGFLSDVTGRLDLLWADGRATARNGDDGYWYFTPAPAGAVNGRDERGGRHG